MHDIAFIGKARSGKDTAGAWLVAERGYKRLAFADPLKDMLLRMDPLIPWMIGSGAYRLSHLISETGWEEAKDSYPEVRRLLQATGEAVRALDRRFWVDLMQRSVSEAPRDTPLVVTDVRYRNEAIALRVLGFTLVRLTRPEAGADGSASAHASETELDSFRADHTIDNGGTLDGLYTCLSYII